MKKLLATLGAICIVSGSSVSVISCGSTTTNETQKSDLAWITNIQDNYLANVKKSSADMIWIQNQALLALSNNYHFENIALNTDVYVYIFSDAKAGIDSLITSAKDIAIGTTVYVQYVATSNSQILVPNSKSGIIPFNVVEQQSISNITLDNPVLNFNGHATRLSFYDYDVLTAIQKQIHYVTLPNLTITYLSQDGSAPIALSDIKVGNTITVSVLTNNNSTVLIPGGTKSFSFKVIDDELIDLSSINQLPGASFDSVNSLSSVNYYDMAAIKVLHNVVKQNFSTNDVNVLYFADAAGTKTATVNDFKPGGSIYVQFQATDFSNTILPESTSPIYNFTILNKLGLFDLSTLDTNLILNNYSLAYNDKYTDVEQYKDNLVQALNNKIPNLQKSDVNITFYKDTNGNKASISDFKLKGRIIAQMSAVNGSQVVVDNSKTPLFGMYIYNDLAPITTLTGATLNVISNASYVNQYDAQAAQILAKKFPNLDTEDVYVDYSIDKISPATIKNFTHGATIYVKFTGREGSKIVATNTDTDWIAFTMN